MADVPFVNQYKDNYGSYLFPSDEIDPKKKTREWGTQVCEALYAYWLNDQAGIPYSRRRDFVLYRNYSEGTQPTEKYMEGLNALDQKRVLRKGWQNLSWDILPIMPVFLSIATAIFKQTDYNIFVTASDSNSQTQKEEAKYEQWAKIMLNAEGLQYKTDSAVTPRSFQEHEVMFNLSFKLGKEIFIKKWLQDGFFHYSNWEQIATRCYRDSFVLGVEAAKTYMDGDKVCGRYVDPANLIVSYSNDPTFANIDKAAELVPYRVATLRPLLYKEGYSEYDIQQVLQQGYLGLWGNPLSIDTNTYYNVVGLPYYKYDDYKILVLDAEWDSDDVYVNSREKTSNGREIVKQRAYDYDSKDKQVERTAIHVIYKNKWVVGTKMSFDFGLLEDTPRSTTEKGKYKNKAEKSFKVYKWTDNSIVARCISALDDIQTQVMVLRNAKAKARPQGLAIEITALENTAIAGKTTPRELMRITRTEGDVLWKATTMYSQNNLSQFPIQELKGGIGVQLEESIRIIEFGINFVRQMIGMNEISDGTNTNPRQAVGVSEMLYQATNNALQPLMEGYVYLKEKMAANAVCRLLINGNLEPYYDILGDVGTSILELADELKHSEFSYKIEAKPDKARKDFIRQLALKAQETPLTEGGISAANFFDIDQDIENGDLKLAQFKLAYYEDMNKAQALKMQQDNIQLQQQAASQTEQVKAQSQQQTDAQKLSAAMELEKLKGQNAIQLAQVQHDAKMKEIALEQQAITGAKVYTADKSHQSAIVKAKTDIVKEGIKQGKKKEAEG